MSKIEDFENAPIGATATNANGLMTVKIDDDERSWLTPLGTYLYDDELAVLGYTLNPLVPATAREALDLAWELAHEVKPGQVIPKGTRYLEVTQFGMQEHTALRDSELALTYVPVVRTVEPLPDPEPDWLNAPAVMATCGCHGIELWHPYESKDGLWVSASGEHALWSTLREVTPLYPKE